MEEEIKEKIKAYYIGNDIDKVLDYITNLQKKEDLFEKIVYKYDELKQENERLRKELELCKKK